MSRISQEGGLTMINRRPWRLWPSIGVAVSMLLGLFGVAWFGCTSVKRTQNSEGGPRSTDAFEELIAHLESGRIPTRQASPAFGLATDVSEWDPDILKESARMRLVAQDIRLDDGAFLQLRVVPAGEAIELALGDEAVVTTQYAVRNDSDADVTFLDPSDATGLRTALLRGDALCVYNVLGARGEIAGKGEVYIGVSRVPTTATQPGARGRLNCPYFASCRPSTCERPFSGLRGTCSGIRVFCVCK